MTTIAQFENVGLRHATGTGPAADAGSATDALADITVSLHPGMFYLLTGPGGAGKTSFLDLLGLVHRPTRGTLHLFGEEVAAMPRARLPALRRRIGMVHRDGRLLPHLSVAANVALPLRIAGVPMAAIGRSVDMMLDQVGMIDRAQAMPADLSAAEQQQVAVARAAIARPALILADEPTGTVDPATADRLLVLLGSLAAGATTIVMATHDSRLFTRLPRARMLRLEHGRLHDPAARTQPGVPPAPIPPVAA